MRRPAAVSVAISGKAFAINNLRTTTGECFARSRFGDSRQSCCNHDDCHECHRAVSHRASFHRPSRRLKAKVDLFCISCLCRRQEARSLAQRHAARQTLLLIENMPQPLLESRRSRRWSGTATRSGHAGANVEMGGQKHGVRRLQAGSPRAGHHLLARRRSGCCRRGKCRFASL